MTEDHLKLEELAEVLTEGDADVFYRVLPHLAARCSECLTVFQLLLDLQERWGYWDARILANETAVVDEHLEALLEPASFEGRFALLHKDSELPSWCLGVRLLELSREAGAREEALELSLLGCRAAELLGEPYDPEYVADLHARLLARAAALLRDHGEQRAAAYFFTRAADILKAGTGDPAVAEELAQMKHTP